MTNGKDFFVRDLPENASDLESDSRWPALFPSAMCIVTTSDGDITGLEKVVAPVIVNRFPYIMSLSFCTENLSQRHHSRRHFLDILERGGNIAVQFLPSGDTLDNIMDTIQSTDDNQTQNRIEQTGLTTRKAISNNAPVFSDAYLVYEAQLVKPTKDLEGNAIYTQPFEDIGSHRIYFLEINNIQLREDIAQVKSQIAWESLPVWEPQFTTGPSKKELTKNTDEQKYKKSYNPHYKFPSEKTIAFASDYTENGMAVKTIEPVIEFDNDNARWPCFFPSSVGMITSFLEDKTPNLMPCGSTAIVCRSPFLVGICVGYAKINERYKPRSSLTIIREAGKFGCGVPFVDDKIISAITYSGNISIDDDKDKILNSKLTFDLSGDIPLLLELPITFECQVVKEILLGTHVLFLGEVSKIYVRKDVNKQNPLKWHPWARINTQLNN